MLGNQVENHTINSNSNQAHTGHAKESKTQSNGASALLYKFSLIECMNSTNEGVEHNCVCSNRKAFESAMNFASVLLMRLRRIVCACACAMVNQVHCDAHNVIK